MFFLNILEWTGLCLIKLTTFVALSETFFISSGTVFQSSTSLWIKQCVVTMSGFSFSTRVAKPLMEHHHCRCLNSFGSWIFHFNTQNLFSIMWHAISMSVYRTALLGFLLLFLANKFCY
jgi:hypothetical protein